MFYLGILVLKLILFNFCVYFLIGFKFRGGLNGVRYGYVYDYSYSFFYIGYNDLLGVFSFGFLGFWRLMSFYDF